jgi:AcrR family transcriptional regulator
LVEPASGEAAGGDSVERDMRKRILAAAFQTFTEKGYAGASTVQIATLAKVSKRDLYAKFGSKHAMLLACVEGRTIGMGLAVELPTPTDRNRLETTLMNFGQNILREASQPVVIAMYRLAIAEAKRSPEVAQVVESAGRGATRRTLADLFTRAGAAGLLEVAEPLEMADQYLGLLWEGLRISLLMGLVEVLAPAEIERRAQRATSAFLRIYPKPSPE